MNHKKSFNHEKHDDTQLSCEYLSPELRGFSSTCVVTSFKIRNHYIVANLTVAVHSAEDCCASSMKFWVPKKVVLFIVLLFTCSNHWVVLPNEKMCLMVCLQNPVARKLKSLLDYCSGRAQITIAASFLYFLYFHPLLELIWVLQFSSFATPSFLIFCFVNTCNYICIYTRIYIYIIYICIYIYVYI